MLKHYYVNLTKHNLCLTGTVLEKEMLIFQTFTTPPPYTPTPPTPPPPAKKTNQTKNPTNTKRRHVDFHEKEKKSLYVIRLLIGNC